MSQQRENGLPIQAPFAAPSSHQVRLQRQEVADLEEARDLPSADQSRQMFHSFAAELSYVGAALAEKQVSHSPLYRFVPLSKQPKALLL